MKLEEIKKAVDEGKTVHWSNNSYKVVKNNRNGEYFIAHTSGHLIGLTWADGVTLNAKEEQFYIAG